MEGYIEALPSSKITRVSKIPKKTPKSDSDIEKLKDDLLKRMNQKSDFQNI